MPEGREEEQEIGKLFEKIMKGNFPKYGKSIREETKATLSEIKKNPQGTNSERKEARVQINNWNLGK